LKDLKDGDEVMKKILGILFVVIIYALSLFSNQVMSPVIGSNLSPKHADLTFAVIGDIHGNTDSLQKAIRDLHNIDSSMDALILNGDTVDQGIEREYNTINMTLSRNKAILPKIIIKNIGNHEYFNYEIEKNSPGDVKVFIKRYLDFAGEKKVYHDKWINGYHFISLGSEDGNSNTLDSIRAYISKEQLEWLKAKVAENYQSGKPIFVFLHQPLNGSPNKGWIGTDQSNDIKEIVSQYPEVILFTSHTHADLTEKSIVTNQPYTTVHTGAIHYTIVQQGQKRTREPFIKGLYVQVNKNTVTINGRDFKEKRWIFTKEITK
jgi:3',5'-cyclic-AMP phosphodiesterase